MTSPFLAAVVQLETTEEVEENWSRARTWLGEAAGRGARFVALPENFLYVGPDDERAMDLETWEGRFSECANELGIWLLAGSIREAIPEKTGMRYNTSLLFDPKGNRVARYRKIHLFDVDVPGMAVWRESAHVVAGGEPVVAKTELGTIGLSICYDLRFPELYRALMKKGAEIVCVPSNFRLMTGKDHWMPLLRARAIENGCWVLAPGLHGEQYGGRWAYGKSCIVDPWGAVVARMSDREGIICATIDPAHTEAVRARIPSNRHARLLD